MKGKRLGGKRKPAKVGIDRKGLLGALERVRPGVARDVTHGFGASDRFVLAGGMVCAYNDSVGVAAPFDTGLDCSVLADDLHGALSKMSDDTVALGRKGDQLTIKGERAEFGLGCADPAEGLLAFFGLKGKGWRELSKCFLDAVSMCAHTAAADERRMEFTGVCFRGKDVFSTDNARISWYRRKKAFDGELLIPAAALAGLAGHAPAEYFVGEGWVFFRDAERVVFGCRLLEADFPDCRPMFPKQKEMEGLDSVTLTRDEMKGALTRANVLLAGADALDRTVKLTFGDVLVCETERKERGWFREEVGKKKVRRECSFFINPDFLLQALELEPEMDLYFVDNSRVMLAKGNFRCLMALYGERD